MKTIRETTGESGGLMLFNKSLEVTGMCEVLSSQGPFTVFAPTDGAFERLPSGVVDELMEDPEMLKMVLSYHIVPEKLSFEMLVSKKSLVTLNGDELTIGESTYGPLINDSKIITPDIECSNGLIHVVNYVLFPGLVKAKEGV